MLESPLSHLPSLPFSLSYPIRFPKLVTPKLIYHFGEASCSYGTTGCLMLCFSNVLASQYIKCIPATTCSKKIYAKSFV